MGASSKADEQRVSSATKGKRGKPFAKGNPHAFKPGQSGNPKGRPTDHAQLRALIQEIAGEEIVIKGKKLTRLEHMLLAMFKSRSPADRQNVLEHGYGKVPQQLDMNVKDVDAAIERELARLAAGSESEVSATTPTDTDEADGRNSG